MNSKESRRVALVTGAANGIGRATAARLHADGFQVVAIDRDGDRLATLCDGLDGRIASLVQDVAAEDAPQAIVRKALDTFGRVDVLANIAGIGAAKEAGLTSDAEFDRFVATNLRSVFRLSREALAHMQAGAAIVSVSSTFGLVGFPQSSSYAATKAAIIGLTRQMAVDYGPRGIRVNAVAPGLIATPLTRERIATNPLYRTLLIRGTPFPRIGDPRDVAAAIAFLCSDDAGFINGQVLAVDGGWSATRYSADL